MQDILKEGLRCRRRHTMLAIRGWHLSPSRNPRVNRRFQCPSQARQRVERATMPDLRADIQELYALRTLRERAAALRNQAAEALAHGDVDEALNEHETRGRRKRRWISMHSLLEAALLVKVERLTETRIPT